MANALNKIALKGLSDGTDGQIITYDANGNPVAVGPGTDGQVLTSTGAGSPPAFEAIPTPVDATKMPLAGGTFTGDVTFDNQTNAGRDIVWDESDDALEFKDNTAAVFGDGNDLYVWHNGTDSYVYEANNHLIIKTNTADKKIYLQSDFGIDISDNGVNEYQARFINDGAVELYHDGNKRFETNSVGCALRGTTNYVEGLLRPWAATGVDLGTSSDRFQNLYLHGGMYLGGTGSANYLQDYEEGTFTPKIGGTNNASTYNISGTGNYVKIGKMVHVIIRFHNQDLNNSASGDVMIYDLPFTGDYGGASNASAGTTADFNTYNVVFATQDGSGVGQRYSWYISHNTSSWRGLISRSNTSWADWGIGDWDETIYMDFSGTYRTA